MTKAKRGAYDSYQPLFVIRIDKNALHGGLLDDHIDSLRERVAAIQGSIPYVRVDETERLERAADRRVRGVQKEHDRLLKKHFDSAIKRYIARSTEWRAHRANRRERPPRIAVWSDKYEAWGAFDHDPKVVLDELLGGDFDLHAVWVEAERAYDLLTVSFAAKAKPSVEHAARIQTASPDLDDTIHPAMPRRPKRARLPVDDWE